MNQPLLTVIVPCYNTEKYLDKCISSIVNQTYSNLEILLIDDGSPDNLGIICNEWQERDSRIRVIHKQHNEGLAYARKTGVENAAADYVTFVDSDDWIDENMYSDMMSALLSTNSDIAQCDFCLVHENGSIEYKVEQFTRSITIIDRVESVVMFMRDCWYISYCTKIFKKKLFKNVTFPLGRNHGEEAVVVQSVFHNSSQTVFLDYPYYKYYQRGDSLCRIGNLEKELKKLGDCSDADYDHYSFVKKYPEYHSVLPLKKKQAAESGIKVLNQMVAYPQYYSKEYFNTKCEQMRAMSFSRKEKLPINTKLALYILKLSPKLYKVVRTLYVNFMIVTNYLKITNKQVKPKFI